MTRTEREILDALTEAGRPLKGTALAVRLDRDANYVQRLAKKLVREGLVVRASEGGYCLPRLDTCATSVQG